MARRRLEAEASREHLLETATRILMERGSARVTVAVFRSGTDGVRPLPSQIKLRISPLTYFFGAAWVPLPSVVHPSRQ